MSNENKRLKLAFLNTLILQDKRTSWKITNEYIAQALQKHCGDITYIDPIQLRLLLLGKIVNKSAQLLLKKSFMYYHSFLIARSYGKIMTQKLAASDFDVIKERRRVIEKGGYLRQSDIGGPLRVEEPQFGIVSLARQALM